MKDSGSFCTFSSLADSHCLRLGLLDLRQALGIGVAALVDDGQKP